MEGRQWSGTPSVTRMSAKTFSAWELHQHQPWQHLAHSAMITDEDTLFLVVFEALFSVFLLRCLLQTVVLVNIFNSSSWFSWGCSCTRRDNGCIVEAFAGVTRTQKQKNKTLTDNNLTQHEPPQVHAWFLTWCAFLHLGSQHVVWTTGTQNITADGDGLWLWNWFNPVSLWCWWSVFELISLATGGKCLLREVCVSFFVLKVYSNYRSRHVVTADSVFSNVWLQFWKTNNLAMWWIQKLSMFLKTLCSFSPLNLY